MYSAVFFYRNAWNSAIHLFVIRFTDILASLDIPTELQDCLYEYPVLDLHLSISNGFVSSKIYDNRDDFDFDIVNFPFLDGCVPLSISYGVYISQLIRFA